MMKKPMKSEGRQVDTPGRDFNETQTAQMNKNIGQMKNSSSGQIRGVNPTMRNCSQSESIQNIGSVNKHASQISNGVRNIDTSRSEIGRMEKESQINCVLNELQIYNEQATKPTLSQIKLKTLISNPHSPASTCVKSYYIPRDASADIPSQQIVISSNQSTQMRNVHHPGFAGNIMNGIDINGGNNVKGVNYGQSASPSGQSKIILPSFMMNKSGQYPVLMPSPASSKSSQPQQISSGFHPPLSAGGNTAQYLRNRVMSQQTLVISNNHSNSQLKMIEFSPISRNHSTGIKPVIQLKEKQLFSHSHFTEFDQKL